MYLTARAPQRVAWPPGRASGPGVEEPEMPIVETPRAAAVSAIVAARIRRGVSQVR